MANEEIIDPQYVPPWDERVDALLTSKMSPGERTALREQVLIQFEHGMWHEQASRSRTWMHECLEQSGATRAEAGRRLDVHPSHIGRWLTGESELGFDRFQHFYVCYGLGTDIKPALKDRETLNLGGYLHATAFIRSVLIGNATNTAAGPPTIEALLCLYHFYANWETLEGLMETEDKRRHAPAYILDELKEILHRYLPAEQMQVATMKDLAAVLTAWGTPWLICLRLLAEEEGGFQDFFISARRPVRLTPLNRRRDG